MADDQYHVAGWIARQHPQWLYRAEFGPYATLAAAQQVAQIMNGPGRVMIITRNGRMIATYQNGELVNDFDEVAFLLDHMGPTEATPQPSAYYTLHCVDQEVAAPISDAHASPED